MLFILIKYNMFSDGSLTSEMKSIINGNYLDVLENNLFLRLYNELGLLSKENFSSNVVKHLSDFLNVNPQE